jgi:predicted metal-binding membrane protein
MSAMGGMPMPGGWTMSMAWMRMPGQTWPGAVTSFLGMWVVMMVAMMLPPLLPALAGFRRNRLVALAGAGYFSVWALWGAVVYAVGSAVARTELHGAGCLSAGLRRFLRESRRIGFLKRL